MFIRGSKTFFIIFKRTWTQVNAIFTAWTISWFSIYLEILLLEANSGIKGLETSEQSIRNKCLQRSAHLSALKRYMFHEIDERASPPSRSKYYYKIPSPRSNVEPFAAHSRIRRIIPYIFLLRILRTSLEGRRDVASPRGDRSRHLDLSTGRGRLRNSISESNEDW